MTTRSPLVLNGGRVAEMPVGDAVPVSNGGTGQTTANDGLNALLPSQSGANGKVLQSDGTDASWQTVAGSGAGADIGLIYALRSLNIL